MDQQSSRQDFFAGAAYLHAGIRAFYRTPALWVYGILPMALVLIFYILLLFLLFSMVIPLFIGLLPDPEAWSVWLRWLIYTARVLIYITATAALLLTGMFFLCTLYEAAGALFFDGLVMRFEKERYGVEHTPVPFRKTFRFMVESVLFSLVTMLLSLLLLIPALYIPVVGMVPAALVIGYRFGVTYLFSSAFADGRGSRELRRLLPGKRMFVLGLGVSAYLWLLIPFAAILLLPGFALGGAMLYRERLLPAVPPDASNSPPLLAHENR